MTAESIRHFFFKYKYEPLNQNWSDWQIISQLFPLQSEKIQNKFDIKRSSVGFYGTPELARTLSKRFLEASLFLAVLKNADKDDPFENRQMCEEILQDCKLIFTQLQELVDVKGAVVLEFCAKFIECDVSQVLPHLSAHLGKLMVNYFNTNKNYFEANKLQMTVVLKVERQLQNGLNFVYLIVRHAVHLMLDCWEEESTFFKQSHYLLYCAETLLENLSKHDVPITEQLNEIMQYLFYAWVVYVGRLVDASLKILNEGHGQDAAIEDLITEMGAVKVQDQLITLDLKLIEKAYFFPNKPVRDIKEIQGVYAELLTYTKLMKMWGPLQVTETITSFDMMQTVLSYILEMFKI